MPLLESFLAWFSLPSVGLAAVFVSGFFASTLLPMGSEPFVVAYLATSPHLFWPTIAVATLGNTLGGMVSYAMGSGLHEAVRRWLRGQHQSPAQQTVGPGAKQDSRWEVMAKRLGQHGDWQVCSLCCFVDDFAWTYPCRSGVIDECLQALALKCSFKGNLRLI